MDWFLYDNGLRHERVKMYELKGNISAWEIVHLITSYIKIELTIILTLLLPKFSSISMVSTTAAE